MSDEDFEKAQRKVREAIERGENKLELRNLRIDKLPDLSGLPDLRSLNIISSDIADISAATSLKKLYHFLCRRTLLRDLSALSELTELRFLIFYDTPLQDLSPLSQLSKLEELGFYNVEVADLEPLRHLTSLSVLALSKTSTSNIEPVAHLPNLSALNIEGTLVTDLSPLKQAASLSMLSFGPEMPERWSRETFLRVDDLDCPDEFLQHFGIRVERGPDEDELSLNKHIAKVVRDYLIANPHIDGMETPPPLPEGPKLFLSYNNEDREQVRFILNELNRRGIPTFWDQDIPAGRDWGTVIEEELEGAALVATFFTANSVESTAVKAEADIGFKAKKLVPICIENTPMPYPFGRAQYVSASWMNMGRIITALESEYANRLADLDQQGQILDQQARRSGHFTLEAKDQQVYTQAHAYAGDPLDEALSILKNLLNDYSGNRLTGTRFHANLVRAQQAEPKTPMVVARSLEAALIEAKGGIREGFLDQAEFDTIRRRLLPLFDMLGKLNPDVEAFVRQMQGLHLPPSHDALALVINCAELLNHRAGSAEAADFLNQIIERLGGHGADGAEGAVEPGVHLTYLEARRALYGLYPRLVDGALPDDVLHQVRRFTEQLQDLERQSSP